MISGFITRFEDGIAVIEQCDRTYVKVTRTRLPAFAHTGDFVEEDKLSKLFHIDFAITEKRRQDILRMADVLFE